MRVGVVPCAESAVAGPGALVLLSRSGPPVPLVRRRQRDLGSVLDTRRWESREELRLAIAIWIEAKYNRRRRQRALGKLTPPASLR